jgi:hypothetical protein
VLGADYHYLVQPGELESLENVLESFSMRQGDFEQHACITKKLFIERFSSEVMANGYLAEYVSVLKDKVSV